MKLTKNIIQYYQERKNKSKLFKIENKINIHIIINENNNNPKEKDFTTQNSIVLLKLARKNKKNLIKYIEDYIINYKYEDIRRYYFFIRILSKYKLN